MSRTGTRVIKFRYNRDPSSYTFLVKLGPEFYDAGSYICYSYRFDTCILYTKLELIFEYDSQVNWQYLFTFRTVRVYIALLQLYHGPKRIVHHCC